jgi:hypothetical protein
MLGGDLDLRRPTAQEQSLLGRLLTPKFSGRDELLRQCDSVKVRRIDQNGSLKLVPAADAVPATVQRRIPVEARLADNDGMIINILLHVLDGRLNELEIYRDDIEEVERDIDPEELEILIP